MMRRFRTPEDHNDNGLGVAPFPMRYTKLTNGDFTDNAKVHNLLPDSPMAYILFTSTNADDVLTLPTANKAGRWRLPQDWAWSSGILEFRDLDMQLTASGQVTIEIWEF